MTKVAAKNLSSMTTILVTDERGTRKRIVDQIRHDEVKKTVTLYLYVETGVRPKITVPEDTMIDVVS